MNQFPGFVKIINHKSNIFERNIEIISNQYNLPNSIIKQVNFSNQTYQYILKYKDNQYWVN